MKKHLLALSAAAVLLAPNAVGAEGFSINEWSAEGFAMGGARMFAENDAANMAYNPASLTKIKGEVAKISATYISPHGKYECYDAAGNVMDYIPGVEGKGHNRVHPAWAPGSYYVKQLNDKEWLGFGAYARFGNSCQFKPGSLPGMNNTSSKVNGMSVGLNYAKKLDSKWSASLGAEVNYAWLQVDKTQPGNLANKMQIEGESYALAWNAAANYAFDEKNEMGIVYRSAVNHSMEANVRDTLLAGYTDAYGCVTLPESVMIGYGHKFNDRTRVELNGTWTRWSRFSSLDMNFTGSPYGPAYDHLNEDAKNWKDGWRYAIGIEHKLSDKYSLLGGIAYDESGIPDYREAGDTMGADFMVPTGTRTTFTIGTQYHDEKQTVAFTIGYMKVGDLSIEGDGMFYDRAKMYDSYTKLVSISYQYNF
ncbi:MAG: outer membrane protein transport protein [Phascolarctobacterium sp.]|nr:outer membrane protein transport protein [Phascolarctobacterium sp.]